MTLQAGSDCKTTISAPWPDSQKTTGILQLTQQRVPFFQLVTGYSIKSLAMEKFKILKAINFKLSLKKQDVKK